MLRIFRVAVPVAGFVNKYVCGSSIMILLPEVLDHDVIDGRVTREPV
jgi:hypothetical protein